MKYHQSDSKTYGINKLALIPSFTVRDVQYRKFFNGYHRERAFGTFWFIVGSSSEAVIRIIKFILTKRLMNPHCWHITHGLYSTHFVGHVLSGKIIKVHLIETNRAYVAEWSRISRSIFVGEAMTFPTYTFAMSSTNLKIGDNYEMFPFNIRTKQT